MKAISLIKRTLFYVRLNTCGLFNRKHDGMASIMFVVASLGKTQHFVKYSISLKRKCFCKTRRLFYNILKVKKVNMSI